MRQFFGTPAGSSPPTRAVTFKEKRCTNKLINGYIRLLSPLPDSHHDGTRTGYLLFFLLSCLPSAAYSPTLGNPSPPNPSIRAGSGCNFSMNSSSDSLPSLSGFVNRSASLVKCSLSASRYGPRKTFLAVRALVQHLEFFFNFRSPFAHAVCVASVAFRSNRSLKALTLDKIDCCARARPFLSVYPSACTKTENGAPYSGQQFRYTLRRCSVGLGAPSLLALFLRQENYPSPENLTAWNLLPPAIQISRLQAATLQCRILPR